MSGWRKFTGALQIASSLTLCLGLYWTLFTSLASLLLTVMMFVAIVVRIRLRDSALKTAPAVIYFFLSLFILLNSFQFFLFNG
jgi:hypothetical protein